MTDHGISLNRHCPCTQQECPIRGNCVLCIQNHLVNGRHLPECIQNVLRPAVKDLAVQMELKIDDGRPDADYWSTYDKDGLVNRSFARHKKSRKKEKKELKNDL